MNYKSVSAQVFEFQEDDYIDNDRENIDSSSNTNDNAYSNGDEDENANTNEDEEDDDSSEKKSSKKKKKGSEDMDGSNYGMSADVQKYYVQKYDLNGKFLGGFGSKGDGDGQFLHAHNIAVDSQGNIYVTDEQKWMSKNLIVKVISCCHGVLQMTKIFSHTKWKMLMLTRKETYGLLTGALEN